MNLLFALAVFFTVLVVCVPRTIDSTDEGILAVDRNGRIVLYNRRAAEMWNVSDDLASRSGDRALLTSWSWTFRDATEARARRGDVHRPRRFQEGQ